MIVASARPSSNADRPTRRTKRAARRRSPSAAAQYDRTSAATAPPRRGVGAYYPVRRESLQVRAGAPNPSAFFGRGGRDSATGHPSRMVRQQFRRDSQRGQDVRTSSMLAITTLSAGWQTFFFATALILFVLHGIGFDQRDRKSTRLNS